MDNRTRRRFCLPCIALWGILVPVMFWFEVEAIAFVIESLAQ